MIGSYYEAGSKHRNSTSRTPYTGGTSADFVITGNFNRTNPVFKIAGQHPNARFAKLGNDYYFVDNAEVVRDITYLYCTLDALATYKTEIGMYTTVIDRAASEYDDLFVDRLYNSSGSTESSGTINATIQPFSDSDGCFVIQYMGAKGIRLAAMSKTEFAKFTDALWADYSNVTASQVLATITNPAEYILDCKFYPLPATYWGNTISSLCMGNININTSLTAPRVTAYDIDPFVVPTVHTSTISIPYVPESDTRPSVKASPYCAFSLYVPGGNWVTIPNDDISTADDLIINYNIDPISGDCLYKVYGEHTNGGVTSSWHIMDVTAQIGIPWAIASTKVQMPNFSGGLVSGLISTATSLAQNFVNPTASVQGGLNGLVSVRRPLALEVKYQRLEAEDIVNNGRPLGKERRINLLSGFVKCAVAELEIPDFQSVVDGVNNDLRSGFYYE